MRTNDRMRRSAPRSDDFLHYLYSVYSTSSLAKTRLDRLRPRDSNRKSSLTTRLRLKRALMLYKNRDMIIDRFFRFKMTAHDKMRNRKLVVIKKVSKQGKSESKKTKGSIYSNLSSRLLNPLLVMLNSSGDGGRRSRGTTKSSSAYSSASSSTTSLNQTSFKKSSSSLKAKSGKNSFKFASNSDKSTSNSTSDNNYYDNLVLYLNKRITTLFNNNNSRITISSSKSKLKKLFIRNSSLKVRIKHITHAV